MLLFSMFEQTFKNIDDFLQHKTFHGREKKSLAYILGIMNMILHGIEAPNIVHGNTFAEKPIDAAFAAIHTATANTQRVLQNAKEVFERY